MKYIRKKTRRRRKIKTRRRQKLNKKTQRRQKLNKKTQRRKGIKMRGGAEVTNNVIQEYLNGLYSKAGIPMPTEDKLKQCYFDCNKHLDLPSFGPPLNEKYKRADVGVEKLKCNLDTDGLGRPEIKMCVITGKNEICNKSGKEFDETNCTENTDCSLKTFPEIKAEADEKFPKDYFLTINKKDEGHEYFKNMYIRYFGEDYNTVPSAIKQWNIIKSAISTAKIQNYGTDKDKTVIILGPAELLYPFSSDQENYNVLSHGTWTPNINFNYIIDVLCDKGELFFVLPTGASNKKITEYEEGTIHANKNRYSLASDCTAFVRATLSELLIIKELEQSERVKVSTIGTVYNIPNSHLKDKGNYDVIILRVEKIKYEQFKDKDICTDPIIKEKSIDYTKEKGFPIKPPEVGPAK